MMKGGSAALAVYVAILCCISACVLGIRKDSVPRKTISHDELQNMTSVRSFTQDSYASSFNTFLVDQQSNRLYVGAINAIFILNLTSVAVDPFKIEWNVTEKEHQDCIGKGKAKNKCYNYIRILKAWNDTHLFACGTYAFDPHCAYIRIFGSVNTTESRVQGKEKGRGKCPFEPMQPFAATLADQVLYTATTTDFQGKDPAVVKSMGPQEKIRTEDTIKWLNDPEFVGSTFVKADQGSGDDDKLYFFFSENAREFNYYKPLRIPRVARVCKGDIGGQKTLQKRWTSFLKARLICSDEGLLFDKIHDVFTLQSDKDNTTSTVFYGVFSTRWNNQNVSAVCAYDIADVQKAFAGQYMKYKMDTDKWDSQKDEIPDPRPGTCITNEMKVKGYSTSLDLPDQVLMFVRDHLLMADSILPIGGKPLLIMMDTVYSKIIVQKVSAGIEVFYLGTETGHLHKAVRSHTKTRVVEDYVVFKTDEKVQYIALHKEFIYVGATSIVLQLPAVNCSMYSHCEDCLLAKDPSCSWNAQKLECVQFEGNAAEGMVQDVESDHPQTNTLCKSDEARVPLAKVVPAVNGITVFLQCEPSSAWSTCHWITPHGTLSNNDKAGGISMKAAQDNLGDYKCMCVEDKVQALKAFYSLELDSSTDHMKGKNSVSYFLMFFFLVLGVFLGAIAYKFGHQRCSNKKASKNDHKGNYTEAAGGGTVPSLGSTDEIRPLTISQKSESGLNGTSEKEEDYENMEKEVNGVNIASSRNHTLSIISCQDETSI
ncbi:semaphorin-4F isoform X2 [Scyliorhinus canicula]|uniref:semaphorin-4F isoform X2 n=1 Tax=Scyliorhinus canicula TaxID=7830 RepID=UPI0018F69540|nr:semaphorin-4F isoform X2 [Scyliorhinus canicula]